MAAQTTTKTIYYKRARMVDGAAVDLQKTLTAAAASFMKAAEREMPIVEGSSTLRVMSGISSTSNMFVARLMQYTKNQKQKFFEKDESTNDYLLDAMEPPKSADSKKKREWLESVLYFGVFKDHVVFVGSARLHAQNLEDYLNWILRKSGHFTDEAGMLLTDHHTDAAVAKARGQEVQSIQIGSDLEFDMRMPKPLKPGEEKGGRVKKILAPIGDTADLLEAYFGNWFKDKPLELALKRDEKIELTLVLSYRSRKKTEQGYELMKRLAVAGRNLNKDECVIYLGNGAKLVGDDLKLEAKLSALVMESGLIDEQDLWRKAHTWLNKLIREGLATP